MQQFFRKKELQKLSLFTKFYNPSDQSGIISMLTDHFKVYTDSLEFKYLFHLMKIHKLNFFEQWWGQIAQQLYLFNEFPSFFPIETIIFFPSNFQPYAYERKVKNCLAKNKSYDRKKFSEMALRTVFVNMGNVRKLRNDKGRGIKLMTEQCTTHGKGLKKLKSELRNLWTFPMNFNNVQKSGFPLYFWLSVNKL